MNELREFHINNLSFSQNRRRFLCCDDDGVMTFNVKPPMLLSFLRIGGVSKCEILNQGNLYAVIPSENNTIYNQNTVMIYNHTLQKFVAEIVCESRVISLRSRGHKMIVVTVDNISVFELLTDSYRVLLNLETRPNPIGLCEITPFETSTNQIIAYPGSNIGSVHILDISNLAATQSIQEIKAHRGEIACLAINPLGTLIATARFDGTSIKIWDTCRKVKVAELSLGTDTKTLSSLTFSSNSEFLCCSSVNGIVHIFDVICSDSNSQSILSQSAIATFIRPSRVGGICTFWSQDTVIAVFLDCVVKEYKFVDGKFICSRRI